MKAENNTGVTDAKVNNNFCRQVDRHKKIILVVLGILFLVGCTLGILGIVGLCPPLVGGIGGALSIASLILSLFVYKGTSQNEPSGDKSNSKVSDIYDPNETMHSEYKKAIDHEKTYTIKLMVSDGTIQELVAILNRHTASHEAIEYLVTVFYDRPAILLALLNPQVTYRRPWYSKMEGDMHPEYDKTILLKTIRANKAALQEMIKEDLTLFSFFEKLLPDLSSDEEDAYIAVITGQSRQDAIFASASLIDRLTIWKGPKSSKNLEVKESAAKILISFKTKLKEKGLLDLVEKSRQDNKTLRERLALS